MLRIYLVRHGETLFNVQNKIQGWCDSPLTKTGIAQAQALHDALSKIAFVHAYCSTSERCIDTANFIIEGRTLELTPCKCFKELHFGEWEGESEERLFLAPDPMKLYEAGFAHLGGETMPQLTKRMLDGLDMIAQQHQDGNVLLVSHGGAIINLVMNLAPALVGDLHGVANCSVTELVYDGAFHVERFNQVLYR